MTRHHQPRNADHTEAEKAGVVFTVTSSIHGHANVEHAGIYTGTATSELVAKTYYHPFFGGRQAWAVGGRWGCVVHLD